MIDRLESADLIQSKLMLNGEIPEIIQRLLDKSIIVNNCLVYEGALDKDGYGRIWFNKNDDIVHIIVAEFYLNHIRRNLRQVNHKSECLFKSCWNPDHLYIGSHSQNMMDSVNIKTHVNARKLNCKCGRQYDRTVLVKGRIWRRCSHCTKLADKRKYDRIKRFKSRKLKNA